MGKVYAALAVESLKVKIGWTSNSFEKRFADADTSFCSEEIRLLKEFPGTQADEYMLHQLLHRSSAPAQGREWFYYTREVRDFISNPEATLASAVEKAQVRLEAAV